MYMYQAFRRLSYSLVGYGEVFGTQSSVPQVSNIDECPSHCIKTWYVGCYMHQLLFVILFIIEAVHGYYECRWR